MGLNHKDVALLNASIEGLGDSFMKNRILDEQIKEREQRTNFQQQYRQDRLDAEMKRLQETQRHNTAMEGKDSSKVNAWLRDPQGGTFNFTGPKTQYDALMGEAEKKGTPFTVLPSKPTEPPKFGMVKKAAKDGSVYTFNINSPAEKEQVDKIVKQIEGAPDKTPPAGAAAVATTREVLSLRERADQIEKDNPKAAAGLREMAARLEKTVGKPERPYTRNIVMPDGSTMSHRMTQEEAESALKGNGSASSGGTKLVYDPVTGKFKQPK